MTRNEVITKLKRECYAATVGRIRQALMNGYVQPLPSKTARGAFDFQPEHLRQLRWYLVHIRPGRRPRFAPRLPIRGSSDRVHRLELAKRQRATRAKQRAARQGRLDAADRNISWLEGIVNHYAIGAPESQIQAARDSRDGE
jgi:hypothetical protein